MSKLTIMSGVSTEIELTTWTHCMEFFTWCGEWPVWPLSVGPNGRWGNQRCLFTVGHSVTCHIVFHRSVCRFVVNADVSSSPILVILMIEALCSSETSVLTIATLPNIPEDGILLSVSLMRIGGQSCNSVLLTQQEHPLETANVVIPVRTATEGQIRSLSIELCLRVFSLH
jgi:hypothetical protein